jgi:hypothetical protein
MPARASGRSAFLKSILFSSGNTRAPFATSGDIQEIAAAAAKLD